MNLANLYAPGSEDMEKAASAELFTRLAARNGIDLTKLSSDQVNELWVETFKGAEEESEKEEKDEEKDESKKDEEKEAAALAEYTAKMAEVREDQRARELGIKMAEAYVEHLREIGAAAQSADPEASKEAAMPPHLAKALGKVRGAASGAASKGKEIAGKAVSKGKELGGKASNFAKEHKGHAAMGAGGAAAAGAGYAAGRAHGKHKEGSAIDMMALEHAVKLAFDAGLDPEEAADRVTAVHTLGLPDSEKLGSTLPQQVQIRALEFLEAAGYPVEWTQ